MGTLSKRNPFQMRISEQIDDSIFLHLYSPAILDIIEDKPIWDKTHLFRSAPGGGKSSLFRTFTPDSLITLYNLRTKKDFRELYERMKNLGVINEEGPRLLAVMLSCAKNYAMIEDLELPPVAKERLLYSLINARVIISSLRGALALKSLKFPDDLSRIKVTDPKTFGYEFHSLLPIPCTGKELFQWANKIERKVCSIIDSFFPVEDECGEGHDYPFSFNIINPECITIDGKAIADKVLFMLDDVNRLATNQREKLFSMLFDSRPPVNVWIAERLEALTPDELISPGIIEGRDYNIVVIENYWRDRGAFNRFEKALLNVADRRVRLTGDLQGSSFSEFLQDELDVQWTGMFEQVEKKVAEEVISKISFSQKFNEWFEAKKKVKGTAWEKAISWKCLDILIEREKKRSQLTLDISLPVSELDKREDNTVKSAAEYFLCQRYKIPYYYGMRKIVMLSSSNIEQFLSFGGDLFEVIISGALIKRSSNILSAKQQEKLLKKIAEQKWEEIPRRVPNGKLVKNFLSSLGELAKKNTLKPNAPYAPGVTGVGINEQNIYTIKKNKDDYQTLISVLSSCIAYNLLEPVSVKQGGKNWTVLYLNRFLCLYFSLPFNYGGWRPVGPKMLNEWFQEGYKYKDNGNGDVDDLSIRIYY